MRKTKNLVIIIVCLIIIITFVATRLKNSYNFLIRYQSSYILQSS